MRCADSEAAAHFDHWQRAGLDDLNKRQDLWPEALRNARVIPDVEYIQARLLESSEGCMLVDVFVVWVMTPSVTGSAGCMPGSVFSHLLAGGRSRLYNNQGTTFFHVIRKSRARYHGVGHHVMLSTTR